MILFDRRKSGILLHLTSLPSGWGTGDMGPMAYHFVDLLEELGQSLWQILPLNPTDGIYGFSPYSSISAFAGNPMLVSPEMLVQDKFLDEWELSPKFADSEAKFEEASVVRNDMFNRALERFLPDDDFKKFCDDNVWWLEDFSLYKAIKSKFRLPWYFWPEQLRRREPEEIEKAKKELAEKIYREKFVQYIFFKQWKRLHEYANSKGIEIFGDMPLYVAHDSADVWANQDIFCLGEDGMPIEVAGVPPDYFSSTGQYWGNPLYRWNVIESNGFDWWIKRVKHALDLYDIVRIDHFRGLISYWAIPFGQPNAVNGKWLKGPAEKLIPALRNSLGELPIIAEDLGDITDDVRDFMAAHDIPGMRVLLFGLDNPQGNIHTPYHYVKRCVAYTGTQDNNTSLGWYLEEASSREIRNLILLLGRKTGPGSVARDLIRLIELSVAELVIIPYQDILGLGSFARINKPASSDGNWQWRMNEKMMSLPVLKWFKEITEFAGRH